jgi:hypothetical protein
MLAFTLKIGYAYCAPTVPTIFCTLREGVSKRVEEKIGGMYFFGPLKSERLALLKFLFFAK